MRALLVNAHGADPSFGGAERYVRDLALGLRSRGHDVQILSAFPQAVETEIPVEVLHDHDWRDARSRRLRNHLGDLVSAPWRRLRRVLERAQPDIVHTNNLPGFGSGIWEVARQLGLPVVHSVHDYHLLCPRTTLMKSDGITPCRPSPLLCGARSRRLARWSGGVDSVVFVSEHIAHVLEGLFPDADRFVVPPAIELLGSKSPPPVSSPPNTIGYLGVLNETKGVGLLLDAAPTLQRVGLSLRLAGDGPLRARAAEEPAVDYVGRLEGDDVADFIASCDAGVAASLWDEPGPLVVCEWLAAGRPVVTTCRGGLAEAARRGGVLCFEDETATGLAAAVMELHDLQRWSELLATVPRPVDDRARWVDQHENAYAAALERAVRRAA